MHNEEKITHAVGEDLLGEVSTEVASTEISTDVLDIVPATQVEGETEEEKSVQRVSV